MGAINRVQGAYQPDCWGQAWCRTSWQIDEETPESWHSLPFGRFVVDAFFSKQKYKMGPCIFTIAWHQRSWLIWCEHGRCFLCDVCCWFETCCNHLYNQSMVFIPNRELSTMETNQNCDCMLTNLQHSPDYMIYQLLNQRSELENHHL